jgi:hypothetical protein
MYVNFNYGEVMRIIFDVKDGNAEIVNTSFNEEEMTELRELISKISDDETKGLITSFMIQKRIDIIVDQFNKERM